MQHVLVVYSPSRIVTGQKLSDIAKDAGIQLRFMALGGYISTEPEMYSKPLTDNYRGARTIVGGFEEDAKALAEFDGFVERHARDPIAAMLNGGRLPWCEFRCGQISYQKAIAEEPKDKAKFDGSVPKQLLSALKSARTRYIIENYSRRREGRELMERLAEGLALATKGFVARHHRSPQTTPFTPTARTGPRQAKKRSSNSGKVTAKRAVPKVHLKRIKELVSLGADINAADHGGLTSSER
jgi:hypothetical protein